MLTNQNKREKAQERVRQQNGEAQNNMVTSEHWTIELDNMSTNDEQW